MNRSRKKFQTPESSGDVIYCEKQIELFSIKLQKLDNEIDELQASGFSVEELDEYISKLHRYNELKDIGQMLLGKLAFLQETTTKSLYPKYGLEFKD